MSQINVRNLSNENDDGAPDIVGVSTFSATSYIVPPVGNTAQRPDNPQEGDLRFNTDSASLEYFRGEILNWEQIEMTSPDLNGGARGMLIGGTSTPNYGGDTEYLTISTLGSSATFGNMNNTSGAGAACGSRTRWVNAGGNEPGNPSADYINYHQFASLGDSADFGDLSVGRWGLGGLSNQTRGVFTGGSTSGDENNGTNTIDYITIAATGNAKDFGDMNTSGLYESGCASSTRGVIQIGKAGASPSTTNSNVMDYITIATTGNSADFGDATGAISSRHACSNSTRGVVAGGSPGYSNVIEYITIASLGNATDFGDLTQARVWCAAVSSPTRAVWSGGYRNSPSAGFDTTQDYVEIMTTGNALDFGDVAITSHTYQIAATSNAHGGL